MNGVQMPLQKLNSETGTGNTPTFGYECLKSALKPLKYNLGVSPGNLNYRISSYNCRGNYSFLNSSSEETIQVFISLM